MNPIAVDLAILIALPEEFEQLVSQFFGEPEIIRDSEYGNYYYRFHFIPLNREPISIIGCFIGGMGPDRAGRQMERLLHKWSPRVAAVVGICGSIDSGVTLCDVVVPSRVDAYLATTKAIPGSVSTFEFEHRGIEYQCDHELIQEAMHFRFAHRALYERWQAECSSRAAKTLGDRLDEYVRKAIVAHRPRIHSGCMASGPVVSAAASFRQWLKKRNSQCTAIEMEAAGIAAAATERIATVRFIAVRGVSDLADERKNSFDNTRSGAIRETAMLNALGLLRALVDLGAFSCTSHSSSELAASNARIAGQSLGSERLANIFMAWMLSPLKALDAINGKTILIVDDEPGNAKFFAALFEVVEANPLSAFNGEEALNILCNTPHIDIVVTDVRMPLMDGTELARQIGINWPHVPVILNSGYFLPSGEPIENCIAYFSRPLNPQEILTVVADICSDESRQSLVNSLPELRHWFYLVYSCKCQIASFMRHFQGKGLFETAFRHKLKDCIASFVQNVIKGANPKLAAQRLCHETAKLSTLLTSAKVGKAPQFNEFINALIKDTAVQHSRIRLIADVDPEALIYLDSDASIFLCIALIELVDNAIEALNKKGNVRIRVRRLELRQNVLMQVWSATGPLSEDLCTKIFEEGYSTKGPERGMGLSIIRRLAEHFGGRIVLSQEDEVEFSVTIPYSMQPPRSRLHSDPEISP